MKERRGISKMKENVEQHLATLRQQLEEQKNNVMITQGAILFAERILKEEQEKKGVKNEKDNIATK